MPESLWLDDWMLEPKVAAKSLQLCPTLRDPMDGSPRGSSIHGIFQARVLEWGTIAFSNKMPQSISIWKITYYTSLKRGIILRDIKQFSVLDKFCNVDKVDIYYLSPVISVQLLSCVPLFATPWTAAHQTSLSITNS